jgi:hypothetical protein
MQLRPIDIDLEVHRLIEQHRTSFAQSPNDIVRELFGLASPAKGSANKSAGDSPHPVTGDWSTKGVTLPAGTELRMTYNGRTHSGVVSGGAWQIAGAIYTSPSSAADALARSRDGKHVSLNGWRLWEVLKPGARSWVLLDDLRPASARTQRTTRLKAA